MNREQAEPGFFRELGETGKAEGSGGSWAIGDMWGDWDNCGNWGICEPVEIKGIGVDWGHWRIYGKMAIESRKAADIQERWNNFGLIKLIMVRLK